MMRTTIEERFELLLVGGAGLAAAALGLMVVRSPLLAAVAVGALVVAVAALRLGALAFAGAGLAVLPWLVVLESVAPQQLGTLIAAGVAGALLWGSLPLRYDSSVAPFAAAAFVALVLVNTIFATDGEQFTLAAKYIVFAAVALAVSNSAAREFMPRLKMPLLASCAAAMLVHLLVIAAGIGNESASYYDAGEKLGLAADGPHALALLATIVAAAGLTLRRTSLQVAVFALGAVPALLTGVRSALVAIAAALLIYLVRSRVNPRAIMALVAGGVVVVLSGAASVVTARFASEAGEFSSFSSAGSGRGLIWTVALEGWQAAGPFAWVFGAGLKSVVDFEVAALASGFVGHSDVIEVLVQLGVLGFVAWLAVWAGLLRAGLSAIVLVPILIFGAVNGTLEYVAALTFGLCLAVACADPRRSGAA